MPNTQDVPVSEMVLHWSLQGSMLHSLVVAMNIAPLLHGSMTLQERAGTAICGFLSLDMFCLLAFEQEKKQALPRGGGFMAKQTMANLQACSLAALVITMTLNEDDLLFSRGFARASEITIEQFFGSIRTQSASAQHSARSYWQASARQMLRSHKALNKEKPHRPAGEKALTTRESFGIGFGNLWNILDMNGYDNIIQYI